MKEFKRLGDADSERVSAIERVASVADASPAVGDVWPDSAWSRTSPVSVRSEEVES